MILERALVEFLTLEVFVDGDWLPLTADINEAAAERGGMRDGPTWTVDPGTLHVVLVNVSSLVDDEVLKPNRLIRMTALVDAEADLRVPVWTGRVQDISTRHLLDKATNRATDHVSIVAVDAVAALASTTRYGAVVEGGAGFESWSARITRLAGSAPASVTVEVPPDDSPIVRYSL